MPATRTHTSSQNAKASSSNPKHNVSGKQQRRHKIDQEPSDATIGVQKIKSALRQTRRLLAKDKLAADVRVETERRLKALEVDLQKAELSRKEREFAVRYHKVKFFERQKVTRKIKQTLKGLEDCEHDAEKKNFEAELYKLRVDLNYILNFPTLKKYISLFPPEMRKAQGLPSVSAVEKQKTESDREEIRSWVVGQMEQGHLPREPEKAEFAHIHKKGPSQKWLGPGNAAASVEQEHTNIDSVSQGLEQDDFFGEDDIE